jgi:hypothetical protein
MLQFEKFDANKKYQDINYLVCVVLNESGKIYVSVTSDIYRFKDYVKYLFTKNPVILPNKIYKALNKSNDKSYTMYVCGSTESISVEKEKLIMLNTNIIEINLLNTYAVAYCSKKINTKYIYVINGVEYSTLKEIADAHGVSSRTVLYYLRIGKKNWYRHNRKKS